MRSRAPAPPAYTRAPARLVRPPGGVRTLIDGHGVVLETGDALQSNRKSRLKSALEVPNDSVWSRGCTRSEGPHDGQKDVGVEVEPALLVEVGLHLGRSPWCGLPSQDPRMRG